MVIWWQWLVLALRLGCVCCRRSTNVELFEMCGESVVSWKKFVVVQSFLGSYYVYLWPMRLPVGEFVLSSKYYVAYADVYFVV